MKKPLIAAISVFCAAAIAVGGIGGYQIYKNMNTRVQVYPVSLITAYVWDDSSSYGNITTDMTQNVYITEKQIIEEVLVQEGDIVSVGTPLMRMDTTLANLNLEMQALTIDNIDLQISAAARDIQLLESAIITWGTPADPDMSEDILISMQPNLFPLFSSTGGINSADPDAIVDLLDNRTSLFIKDSTRNIYNVKCSPGTLITQDFLYRIMGLDPTGARRIGEPMMVFLQIPSIGKRIYLDGYTFAVPSDFHEMTLDEFMNTYTPEISDINSDTLSGPNPYDGITAQERDRQLEEKQRQLTTLNLDRRQAVLDYEKLRRETPDSVILSTVNGQVRSVGNPDEGINSNVPFITVASEEGFYLEGTINELDLDDIFVGQQITVTSMETGMTAEAEITSVSRYPVSNNNRSYGVNPNTSNYPFTAFLSETSGFQNNQWVSIRMSSDAESANSKLYIPLSYVREDAGESYVYIADENGRLKRQVIEGGATMYGYYQEIKSGLTQDDLITFPYGKNVREGVKTEETDSPYMY